MRIKLFSFIVLGYGITLEYSKSDKDHNPKSKNYNSDGSIKKFSIYQNVSCYSDYFVAFSFFYNYSIVARLHLNRD